MTFPRATGQIPIYYNCPPSGLDVNGYYHNDTKKANGEFVVYMGHDCYTENSITVELV